MQVANEEGQLLSAYQIRTRFPWRSLRLIYLPPFSRDPKANVDQFEGYLNSSNSILYWSKGENILQIEAFEAPLRRIGLPKELVQLSSLGLGVRPGWLVLAAALGFRLTRNRVFR